MIDRLPPFPVDDQTLDLLAAAVSPGPDAERSSVTDLCAMFSELAGSDLAAVESGDEHMTVMWDPVYHPNDVIAALVTEIRRLRAGGQR